MAKLVQKKNNIILNSEYIDTFQIIDLIKRIIDHNQHIVMHSQDFFDDLKLFIFIIGFC